MFGPRVPFSVKVPLYIVRDGKFHEILLPENFIESFQYTKLYMLT